LFNYKIYLADWTSFVGAVLGVFGAIMNTQTWMIINFQQPRFQRRVKQEVKSINLEDLSIVHLRLWLIRICRVGVQLNLVYYHGQSCCTRVVDVVFYFYKNAGIIS